MSILVKMYAYNFFQRTFLRQHHIESIEILVVLLQVNSLKIKSLVRPYRLLTQLLLGI